MSKASGRMFPTTATNLLKIKYKDAKKFIKTEIKTLQSKDLNANGHILRGDPAELITNAANTGNCDLIVLATHGKAGMKDFWKGCIAHRICSFSRIPLLLPPIIEE